MNHLLSPQHKLLQLARTGYRLPTAIADKITAFLDKVYPLLAIVLAFLFLLSSQLIGFLGLIMFKALLYFFQGREINIEVLQNIAQSGSPLDLTLFLWGTFGPFF